MKKSLYCAISRLEAGKLSPISDYKFENSTPFYLHYNDFSRHLERDDNGFEAKEDF